MIFIGGWYLRLFEGIKSISLDNEQELIRELDAFYRGDKRLIIAFRHVAKEDAPLMMFALNRKLQRLIRRANRRRAPSEKIIGHAKFLYGRDVLDWAGKAAAWLFPRIGCVPVQNRSTNRSGLNILRKEMIEGSFPIALAPESQVTYHMYQCSDISSGISALASWGEQSTKDVTIVPIALGYRHADDADMLIRDVLRRWEHQIGLELSGRTHRPILRLLSEATEKTIELLEQLYLIEQDKSPGLRKRIEQVCESALSTAEVLSGLQPEGTFLDRLFRIRYQGVEAVHPEQFDPKQLPPLGRSLADFHALEAHVYLRHSQIVDVLQYIDPDYIKSPCTSGRACEYALNLLDVLNRAQGGNINTRYSPKGKRALVKVGTSLKLTDIGQYAPLSRKEKVKTVTHMVHTSLDTTSKQMEEILEDETRPRFSDDQ
jgi:hypothetical protein